MTHQLTFITGNSHKAEQLSKYLGIPVNHHSLELSEIQSLNGSEIIEHKAREAYLKLKTPVLVDDVSLTIHSMGRLPGPFIKYFLSELGTSKMCKLVALEKNRSALAEVYIGYFDGKNFKSFVGKVHGEIALEPKGDGGFGFDEMFIPKGFSQTRGEMNETDYDATSPRKIALEKLREFFS